MVMTTYVYIRSFAKYRPHTNDVIIVVCMYIHTCINTYIYANACIQTHTWNTHAQCPYCSCPDVSYI